GGAQRLQGQLAVREAPQAAGELVQGHGAGSLPEPCRGVRVVAPLTGTALGGADVRGCTRIAPSRVEGSWRRRASQRLNRRARRGSQRTTLGCPAHTRPDIRVMQMTVRNG